MTQASAPSALETIVTFIELSLRRSSVVEPPTGLRVTRAEGLRPEGYRSLVDRVGRPWHWVDVARADAAELAVRLSRVENAVYLAHAGRVLVGFFELEMLDSTTAELVYLGLVPEAVGRGLGRALLRAAIAQTERVHMATRLVARTCCLDHPAALPLYVSAGFRVVGHQRDVVVPLTPGETAALARHRSFRSGGVSDGISPPGSAGPQRDGPGRPQ